VSHDPSEIILIGCSRNVSDYYQCGTQLCCSLFCVETVTFFFKNSIYWKQKSFV